MKEENTIILGLGLGLGFFALVAFLAFLIYRKEPILTTTAQTTPIQIASAQTSCVPQEETGETSLRESKIGQADKLSEYIKTEEARPRFPHIVNYSIHEANRWYEIILPKKGVKTWTLRCREEYNINYCFEPSASAYMTLSSGGTLTENTAPQGVHAIYVRCAEAGVTIEFELWREEQLLI